MSHIPKFKLVYVEWADHSGSSGWRTLTEVNAANENGYLVSTVGWLIAENKKRITLTACLSEGENRDAQVDHVSTIERPLIKSMRTIRIGKR